MRLRAFCPKDQETKFLNRNQVPKSPRVGRRLLARTAENPRDVSSPEVVRAAPAAVEPQLRTKAPHAEDVRVAVRIKDGFYGD